jgi:hypothetical protein
MADECEGNSNSGQAPPPPRAHGGNGAQVDRPELDRLPPPAFPPGEHSAKYRRSPRTSVGETDLISHRYTDPHVAGLVLHVGRLASALRDHGEAALRTTADMNRFEATLRTYCVGYLVAQREAGEE